MYNHLTFPVFVSVWNKLQGQTTPAHHFKIARWFDKAWVNNKKRLLLLAFRASGKSSLIGLFCVWRLWQNPNTRILVIAADSALAKKMVRQVKRIIEKHPFTKNLKPQTLDQWGSDRFTVKRTQELRDPSMLAKGIHSNLTGTRADIIICDDVEVPKTSATQAKRDDLRLKLHELDYILMPDGTQIYAGTPHNFETIYRTKKDERVNDEDNFLNEFTKLKLPILNKNGDSVWVERFPLSVINDMKAKTGALYFQSQMMVEPHNIFESRLDVKGLQFYDDDMDLQEANSVKTLTIGSHKMISGAAWWDPAFAVQNRKGDKSVVAILYTNETQKNFLHHIESISVSSAGADDEATAQCKIVAGLLKQFHVPVIAIETNGIGKFLPSILRREIARIKAGTMVHEINNRKSKALRIIEAFDVVLAARSLYVRQSKTAIMFRRQLAEWNPSITNSQDDMIDAVAGVLSLQPLRFKALPAGNNLYTRWAQTNPTQIKDFEFKF